jgi:hypothetical protein
VTVDFGKARQAYIGRTPLTKRVTQGLWITSWLDDNAIWTAIDALCATYPTKKSLGSTKGPMVFYPRLGKRRSLGYGTLSRGVIVPDWTFEVQGAAPHRHLNVVHAKAISGKIEQVVEMELVLNTLERELRRLDEHASITFCAAE